jgi:hypothetical protein
MDILKDFKVGVDCDDTHCSVRYYLRDRTLASGIIRTSYTRTNKSPNVIVIITSMDIDRMIEHIMNNYVVDPLTTPNVIRNNSIDKIKEHLSNMGG